MTERSAELVRDFDAGVERRMAQLTETKSAAELLAEIRSNQAAHQRAARARRLNDGEWTPAGGGLEVRFHEARPC